MSDAYSESSAHPADRLGADPGVVLTGPASLAVVIPYLVPIPATGALVMVPVGMTGRIGTLFSRELPPLPQEGSPERLRDWAGEIGQLLARGVALLRLRHDEELALAVYLPVDFGAPPSWFGDALLGDLLPLPGLLDVVAVFGDSWRSLLCRDESCCPPDGSRMLHNSNAALVAAELVAAGFSPLPPPPPGSIEGDPVADALAALRRPSSISARRRLLRRVWPLLQEPAADLRPEQVARLLLAADRPGVRDAMLTRLARRARRNPELWQRQAELWELVAVQAPGHWRAGAWTICAIARWCCGDEDGALAALELVLSKRPGHKMADLLRALILRGDGPAQWLARLAELREVDCLAFDRPPELPASALRAC